MEGTQECLTLCVLCRIGCCGPSTNECWLVEGFAYVNLAGTEAGLGLVRFVEQRGVDPV